VREVRVKRLDPRAQDSLRHGVARRDPNGPCATNCHVADGLGGVVIRGQREDLKLEGEPSLVNQLHRLAFHPDGTIRHPVDPHEINDQ
jgi:hypothetical protein